MIRAERSAQVNVGPLLLRSSVLTYVVHDSDNLSPIFDVSR